MTVPEFDGERFLYCRKTTPTGIDMFATARQTAIAGLLVSAWVLAVPLGANADSPRSDEAEPSAERTTAGHASAGPQMRDRWLDLTAGPFFGRRSFELTTPDDFRLEHTTPLLGVRTDLEARIFVADEIPAAVDLAGAVRYAPFSGRGSRASSRPEGTYLSGTLAGEYVATIARRLEGYGRLGAEVTTYGLESNAEYVGNLYWLGELGLGGIYRPVRGLAVDLFAGAQPVLSARTNRRAFDDSSPTVGAAGRLEVSGLLVPRLRLNFFYDVQYLPLRHPNPRSHPSPGTGRDLLQLGGVSLSWRFRFSR